MKQVDDCIKNKGDMKTRPRPTLKPILMAR